jgi:hypothetical protein
MDTHIVAVYCLCADLLVALRHADDAQCRVTDAEIMTIASVAALFFGGNYVVICYFLQQHGYMPRMLSASRLHRIKDLFLTLFAVFADHWKAVNDQSDSTPSDIHPTWHWSTDQGDPESR